MVTEPTVTPLQWWHVELALLISRYTRYIHNRSCSTLNCCSEAPVWTIILISSPHLFLHSTPYDTLFYLNHQKNPWQASTTSYSHYSKPSGTKENRTTQLIRPSKAQLSKAGTHIVQCVQFILRLKSLLEIGESGAYVSVLTTI